MQMYPLSILFPLIKGIVPNIADQYIEAEIADAVAEVAAKTRKLHKITTQDIQAGVTAYPLELEQGDNFVSVLGVCVNGENYKPSPQRCDVPMESVSICNETNSSIGQLMWSDACFSCNSGYAYQNPTFSVSNDDRYIVLSKNPQADITDGLKIDIAYKPSRLNCEISSDMYEEYGRFIADMAIERLTLYNNKDDRSMSVSDRMRNKNAEEFRRRKGISAYSKNGAIPVNRLELRL